MQRVDQAPAKTRGRITYSDHFTIVTGHASLLSANVTHPQTEAVSG